MPNNSRKEILNQVVCRVMEQTAFLFPEKVDLLDGISFEDIEFIWVNLPFVGDQDGDVSLVIPIGLCRELSANILGEDIEETDAKEKCIDAAKETLNIITGQILTELFGTKAVFNLMSPQIKELVREEFFSGLDKTDYVCNMIEDYPVITVLTMGAREYEHKGTDR